MLRSRLLVLVGLASLLVASACGGETATGESGTDSPPPATTGAASPGDTPPPPDDSSMVEVPETLAFTVATVDGGELSGAELAGTPVAFWFWASWCGRCAAAASEVRQVQADYAGRVHVVGVAGLGSGEGGMRGFVDTHQLDAFPHLADDDGQVWQQFGVTAQEYFVILDADGEIVHDGALRGDALRDQLDALVG